MTVHKHRPGQNIKSGDILVREDGRRFRIVEVQFRPDGGLYIKSRPIKEKPVRMWPWALVSAVVAALAAWSLL